MITRIVTLFFAVCFLNITAQSKKDVIFTINKKPVYTDEFLKVFNKNREIVSDENKNTVDEYLELFINYKLKLKQAHEIGLDTMAAFKAELATYRKQLVEPYLKDSEVTTALIKEAYDRMKYNVNASHILVGVAPDAKPADTLKAYNRILEARQKVLDGVPFETVAKAYSNDPSAKSNGGSLGTFTVFDMVYPFETAVYNNEVGKISMPIKTNYGYHIVLTNSKELSKGEVEVAHIMLKDRPKDTLYAKKLIFDVYDKLKQDGDFTLLAQKHSDDKNSAFKGGKIDKFFANDMIKPFSDASFALENEGDFSKPFRTKFGWHIVKLIKKHPIKELKYLEKELSKKMERSDRALYIGKPVLDRLKKEFDINVDKEVEQTYLKSYDDFLQFENNRTVVSVNGVKADVEELIHYTKEAHKNVSTRKKFNDFVDSKIIEYYKQNLENYNEDFASTLKEYKDGILLFNLLQQKVWDKSEKDTTGLMDFYNKNKQNYMFKKRVIVDLASCTKREKAVQIKKYLEEGKRAEEIKKLVNESPTIHVLFSSGTLEVTSSKLPKNFAVVKGVSKIYEEGNNNFTVVNVKEILEPSQKEYKDAKGFVANDYQNHLEELWIKDLREKNKIKINKRVLKKLVKQYKDK